MRALLFIPLMVTLLLACKAKQEHVPQTVPALVSGGPEGKVSRLSPVFQFNAPEAPITENWQIENVQVTCGATSCPPQVGAIIFVLDDGHIRRCTGFVEGENADRVVSTGHCDGPLDRGFFVLGSGRKKQVRRLNAVLFKKFAGQVRAGEESAATAGVTFALDKPVKDVHGLNLASGRQAAFDKLTVYVVNASGGNELNLRVESTSCLVRRHETLFPYDLSETPDLIWLFGCRIEGGNSGGPAFAEGSADVQAIVQSFSTPEAYARQIREVLHREPTIYEKHWMALSTNVRCLPFPGMSARTCMRVTEEENQRRFQAMQQLSLEKLKERLPPVSFSASFASNQSLFPLEGSTPYESYFESIYIPYCRKSSRDFNEVFIPSEYLRYGFDEWAQLNTESLGMRMTDAVVEEIQGTVFAFNGRWAEPYGPLVNEVEHPRRKWGNRFAIDLPLCPR